MDDGRFQPGRRATLCALGALGLAAAAGGGCTLAPRNARTPVVAALPRDLPAFLAPPAPIGVVSGTRAIDVHAHFFNASDAAVAGYLVHSVGHEAPRLVRKLLGRLERMISGVSYLPPTARDEYERLLETGRQVSGLHASAVQDLLDDQMRTEDKRIETELERAFRKFDVDDAYEEALLGEAVTGPVKARDGLAATMARLAVDSEAEDPYAAEALAAGGGIYLRGLLGFVGRMFRSRWSNLRTFQKVYRPQGVEAAFGALVDFDHWFESRGQSTLDDQMALHALLSRLSGGYLLPIMAYNPWADEITGGASLRRVQKAVEEFGFIGVKIYPPTGFRPWGNAKPDCEPAPRRECLPYPDDPGAIDARMKALFCWSSDNGVPVMAHANSTRGRNEEEDLMSAVSGWRELLAHMQHRGHAPVIHLGHIGGDAHNQDGMNWTKEFAALMSEQGNARVYGDLGYWTGLADCRGDLGACTAGLRLRAALAENPQFDRHLMYGSDWFMINQERGWKAFPRDVAAALAGAFDEPDRVFFGNALECYGLRAGGRHRQRIIDHVGAVPAWMS